MDVCLVSRSARIVLLAVVIALGVMDGARSRDASPAVTTSPTPVLTTTESDRPADPPAEVPLRFSAVGGVD